jgi:hypothetical protein
VKFDSQSLNRRHQFCLVLTQIMKNDFSNRRRIRLQIRPSVAAMRETINSCGNGLYQLQHSMVQAVNDHNHKVYAW